MLESEGSRRAHGAYPTRATAMTLQQRPVRLTVLAIALFVVVLGVASTVVSSQPVTCRLCHASQAGALAASDHRDVSCYRCHLASGIWSLPQQKAAELFGMYPAFLLNRGLSGPVQRVSRTACTSCHSLGSGVATGGGLRIRHRECVPADEKCDTCHAASAHGTALRWTRGADMGACLSCHVKNGAAEECTACHVRAPRDRRPTTASLGIIHGSRWRTTHAVGDLKSCPVCHSDADCSRCHGTQLPHPAGFLATHGAASLSSKAKCSSCHRDRTMCDDCHGLPMPHPASFRAKHARIATSPDDPQCLTCHARADCDNCHSAHQHPTTTQGTLSSKRLPKGTAIR